MTLTDESAAPIVTLLTDFGTADYFVGAMKGAVLSVCPGAQIIDITNEIPPQDIEAGAFTLLAAYETFPRGTVHVAVIDPGVGSERRGLAVEANGHLFIGPDNGLLSYACTQDANARAYELRERTFHRREVSATFHGRDVFAPVAGALANRVSPARFGPEVTDFVQLPALAPRKIEGGDMTGRIIHVDRFGNLITNLKRADVAGLVVGEEGSTPEMFLSVAGCELRELRRTFADGANEPGELFAVWGSAGFLEIVTYCDSAARLTGAKRGDEVRLRRED